LRQKLEELGLVSDLPTPFGGGTPNNTHSSALIRVMSRRSELLDFAAREVFCVAFLKQHEGANGVDFPDRHEIESSIQREETNGNGTN
jgi:hypothetical protein